MEPTPEQIDRAAWKWDRATMSGNPTAYFRNNWRALPGLRAYVEAEVAKDAPVATDAGQ